MLSAKTILRDLSVDTWIRGCPTEQSKEEERNDENEYGQTPPKHDALLFQMRNDTLGSPKSSPKIKQQWSGHSRIHVEILPRATLELTLEKGRWKVRAFHRPSWAKMWSKHLCQSHLVKVAGSLMEPSVSFAAFAGLASLLEQAIYGANRAVIVPFIEQSGIQTI